MDAGESIPWEAAWENPLRSSLGKSPGNPLGSSPCPAAVQEPLGVTVPVTGTLPPRELLADTSPEKDPFTIKNEFAKQDGSPSTGEWLVIITEIFCDYQFQRLKVLKKISVRLTTAHQTTESRNQGYLLGFARFLSHNQHFFHLYVNHNIKKPQIPAVAQYTTHKCIVSPMSQSPPEQLLFPDVSHSSWELE